MALLLMASVNAGAFVLLPEPEATAPPLGLEPVSVASPV
jgi:hypothetical protein